MCKRLLQNYIMHSFEAVANQQKGAAWEYKEPHLQALSLALSYWGGCQEIVAFAQKLWGRKGF